MRACVQCLTEDGHELTRVSVIDDNYNVLYDQLVKPHKPITDYLTRYR
jgi:RNA exonuclease 1